MALGAYRPLLGNRDVRSVLGGASLAGMSAGLTFAVVLAVQADHSIAAAGLVAAVMTVSDGILTPVRGRLVDKRGQRVLLPLAGTHCTLLVGFAVSVDTLPVWALCVVAAPTGMARPPIFASLRSLWRDVATDKPQLETAYSLHATVNEALFVTAPVAVAGIAALVSPQGSLITLAACQAAGAVLFTGTRLSRAWRGEPRTTGPLGALESPGMRTLVLADIGVGISVGALDVAAVAFARDQGSAGAGGLALAALALGSAAGGLYYGSRRWRSALERRYVYLSVLLVAGLLPLGLASSIPVLIILMAVSGLAVAPWIAASMGLIDQVAPAGTATEAMTWVIAASGLGAAIGAALAGQIAEAAGTGWALELGAVGAAAGLLVTLARLRTLRPA